MEKTGLKKDVKLSILIARYVVTIIVLFALTFICFYFAIVNYYSGVDESKAADYSEKEAMDWIHRDSESGYFDKESIPGSFDVIIEDSDGNEVLRQIVTDYGSDLENFRNAMKNGEEAVGRDGQQFFFRVINEYETAYIHYSMTGDNEVLFVILFVIVCGLDVIIPTLVLIRQIRKSIRNVSEYARQISSKDLSASSAKSGIYEMNEIIGAVDFMKDNLTKSIEERWEAEQQKQEEKAQIAHDLKTPLTIIRGNADLLLENCQSDDDREAIETIIKNSERIARSVIDILE